MGTRGSIVIFIENPETFISDLPPVTGSELGQNFHNANFNQSARDLVPCTQLSQAC